MGVLIQLPTTNHHQPTTNPRLTGARSPRYHPAQQPNTALSDGWRETALWNPAACSAVRC